MIIDKLFELDYVSNAKEHNGISDNEPNFKPFWEIQCLANGMTYWGTKKDCIEWMQEWYVEHFYDVACETIKDVDDAEAEAEIMAMEHVKKEVAKHG